MDWALFFFFFGYTADVAVVLRYVDTAVVGLFPVVTLAGGGCLFFLVRLFLRVEILLNVPRARSGEFADLITWLFVSVLPGHYVPSAQNTMPGM